VSGAGPVGVGVVGAGKISDQYLANMARYPDLDVRFVADLHPQLALAQAERHGVADAGTTEQALARDDVELIVNLTVPAAHAEVASAASPPASMCSTRSRSRSIWRPPRR
jgi:predicted dehydrogenase